MTLSALGQNLFQIASPVGSTAVATPSIPVVVITGLSLVFTILVILYLVLLGQGKIFRGIDAKKREKLEAEKQAEQLAAPAIIEATPTVLAPPPAPLIQTGIPAEVVAAISAAVATMGEGEYTLQSITAAQEAAPAVYRTEDRRGRWGYAGVLAGTEPF